jgi:hypothetical protein
MMSATAGIIVMDIEKLLSSRDIELFDTVTA